MAFEDRVMSRPMPSGALETQATKDYHRVEKGLALAQPKRPFGAKVAARLSRVEPQLDPDSDLAQHVRTARAALAQWNDVGTVDDSVSPPPGAASTLTRDQIQDFFLSRHSVRDFDSSRPVPADEVERAVELALASPSVCNRQSWRVHLVWDDALKQTLRQEQNGNAGFGEIPVMAVITVDSRLFAGAGERNQGWVDGGLFAMSLVWALHGIGLDSCMLNMSVTNAHADRVRHALGIPDHDLIIMQIAVGYGRDGRRVARSPRKRIEQILTVRP